MHLEQSMLPSLNHCPLPLLLHTPQSAELIGRLEALKKKMTSPAYEKTPDDVKAADAERLAKAEAELAQAEAATTAMKALLAAS